MKNTTKMMLSMLLVAFIFVAYSILCSIEWHSMNILASLSVLAMLLFITIHRFMGKKLYPHSSDYDAVINSIDVHAAGSGNIIFFISLYVVYVCVGVLFGELTVVALSVSLKSIVIK